MDSPYAFTWSMHRQPRCISDLCDVQENVSDIEPTKWKAVMLPLEIQLNIIESLDNHTSAGTIASCGLACRALLGCSQRKLHSIVYPQRRQDWVRFKEVLLRLRSERVMAYTRGVQELVVEQFETEKVGWVREEVRP